MLLVVTRVVFSSMSARPMHPCYGSLLSLFKRRHPSFGTTAVLLAGDSQRFIPSRNKSVVLTGVKSGEIISGRHCRDIDGGDSSLWLRFIEGGQVVRTACLTMNSTKVRNALSFLAACALCLLHVATANEHLTDDCLKCVQVASSGDERNPVCNEGRCGQFQFSEEYWKKAMSEARSTVPKGSMAFRECAEDLECAETVVILYMDKYGKDCNSDGTKTCDEFARTHWDAIPDIRSGAFGSSAYNSRFEKCHKKR